MTPSVTASTPYKIVRIYLKGASVEVPHMADLPRQAISPEVGLDMQTQAAPAWPGAMECVLRISMHARLAGRNVFLIEVSVAGIFELELSDQAEAHRFVRQVAPAILFPFARKDLASMAVSAGFQPVLLDHVDFDALLSQVIASQQVARSSPAPMRLDVIAAKPVKAQVPAQTEASWPDTLPQPVEQPALEPTPTSAPAMATDASAARQGLGKVGSAWLLLGMVGLTLAAWSLWRTLEPALGRMARPEWGAPTAVAPSPALPALPASPPAGGGVVASPVVVPLATQVAMNISRARLSEQPVTWFTLELGSQSMRESLDVLGSLPSDHPLFVMATPGGRLRVLYGVFESRVLADQAGAAVQATGVRLDQPIIKPVMIGEL